ncbi:MAG: hypothetical protein U0234_18715 [Sandaracinus sp.]
MSELDRARSLEAAGDLEGAARAFAAAGDPQEAARLFTMAARPLEAALALLSGIDMIAGDLPAGERSRAQLAARLLREGGRDDYAKLVLGAIAGEAAAFPTAVLKSVLVAAPEPERRSVRSPAVSSAPASAPSGERRPGGFVVKASVPGGSPFVRSAAPSPSIAPAGAPPRGVSAAPAGSPSIAPTGMPRPGATERVEVAREEPPRPASASASAPGASAAASSAAASSSAPKASRIPTPAPAASTDAGDRYKAEAGWHAADGAAIEETIRQFLATGRKGAAARVAWEAGQFERALEWFVELGLKYQAGSCLRSLNRPTEALAMLLEVAGDDPRYRRACFDVVALARETSRLDFEIDHFLTAFVGEGPKSADECGAFLDLAELYATSGFAIGARRCAEGVLRVTPDDPRATEQMRALAMPKSRSSAPRAASAGAEDLTALPTLDEFRALAKRHAPARPAARK